MRETCKAAPLHHGVDMADRKLDRYSLRQLCPRGTARGHCIDLQHLGGKRLADASRILRYLRFDIPDMWLRQPIPPDGRHCLRRMDSRYHHHSLDIMPLFAPTINSYKRLVENYWAPINISWGLEDRTASIRIIAPPVCKPGATRFEIRIPGADLHPHYALSAILAAGWRGVQKEVNITVPPLSAMTLDMPKPGLLPNTLELALKRFSAKGSIAREILNDEFVDFFTATRDHELRVWREAVTDWFVY